MLLSVKVEQVGGGAAFAMTCLAVGIVDLYIFHDEWFKFYSTFFSCSMVNVEGFGIFFQGLFR